MILNRCSIQLVLLHFLGIDVANGKFKTLSDGVTSILFSKRNTFSALQFEPGKLKI